MYFRVVLFFTLPLLIRSLPISKQFSPHEPRDSTLTVDAKDDVMLFDGFGYPNSQGETMVSLQAYVYPQGAADKPNLFRTTAAKIFRSSSNPEITRERLKMFGITGPNGKSVSLGFEGCGKPVEGQMSKTVHGLVVQDDILVGHCPAKLLTATVKFPPGDSRKFHSTIFNSADGGHGVISDIDDTIKVTNVLKLLLLLYATFSQPPRTVEHMPELYASLAKSLDPLFIYVSGSPFQLYPFLHGYIRTTFPNSQGPILLRTLTTRATDIMNFINPKNTKEYKLAMIDKIHRMYPKKRFLAIGDSGERDPETYGEAFRKYPGFITCIWIRQVEGAKNAADRFAAAFKDISRAKYYVFTDAEIPKLSSVTVAEGGCRPGDATT